MAEHLGSDGYVLPTGFQGGLDHIGIKVKDYEASKAFYSQVLKTVGYDVVMEIVEAKACGLGFSKDKPDFWIHQARGESGAVHLAFTAPSRKAVDEFYETAIAAGAKDNGKPGLRPHYHPSYYGAFVYDADGNNIEAVCHLPEECLKRQLEGATDAAQQSDEPTKKVARTGDDS